MAEHTNVFLPRQTLFHWFHLFICYCTQGYDQLLVWEQAHLICSLFDPALSLHLSSLWPRVSPGSHGLWSLIAIWNPLLYTIQMSTRLCVQLVAGLSFLWLYQLNSSSDQHDIYFILLRLQAIDHFYCDTCPLQRLSCSDLFILSMASFTLSGLITFPTIIVIIVSYLYIVSTVLKIPAHQGTFQSLLHLQLPPGSRKCTVSCCLFMYLTPDTYPELSKVASLCYTLSLPCWILWFNLWETKTSKKFLYKNLEEKYYSVIIISLPLMSGVCLFCIPLVINEIILLSIIEIL